MQRPPIVIRNGGGRTEKPPAVRPTATANEHQDNDVLTEDSEPIQGELLAVERLLYPDASASPLLDKDEEQAITRRA